MRLKFDEPEEIPEEEDEEEEVEEVVPPSTHQHRWASFRGNGETFQMCAGCGAKKE